MPVDPGPCRWELPDPGAAGEGDVVGVGADLEPATVLEAYRRGMFPMRIHSGAIGWWSPDPRGILPLGGVHLSRSLRRSMRRFEYRVDTAFEAVMRACADPQRPYGWIDDAFLAAYTRLFDMGWAHSFESWRDGRLVGGVYGVAIERFFAGESMFHGETDAGKAALVHAVHWLDHHAFELFDVQWTTDHLSSLGAVDVARGVYLELLRPAVEPAPREAHR